MKPLLKQCVTALIAISLLCQSLAALSAPCPLLEDKALESSSVKIQPLEQSKSPCHMAMTNADVTIKATVEDKQPEHSLNCCGEDTCPMSKTMSAAVLLDTPQIASQNIRFASLSISPVQALLAEHGNHLYRPPILSA